MGELLRRPINEEEELGILLPKDAEELFKLVNSSRRHLSKFLPWVEGVDSPSHERAFLLDALDRLAQGAAYHFGIWRVGELCGSISLEIDSLNNSGELGYYLGDRYLGRGIMTRSAEAVLAFGFATLGLNRVEAFVASENIASRRVCLRIGLEYESRSTGALLLHGRYYDRETYRSLASGYLRT